MTALGTRNDFPLPQDVDGGENPLGPSVNTVAASSYSPPQRSFTPTVTAFNDPVRAAALIAAPSEGTQTYRPETGWGSDSDWDAIVERAIAESKSRVPATQATQGLDQDWDAIVEAAIAKTNSATDSDLQHFSSPSMEELNAGRPLEPKPPMVAPENPEGETHEDMIDRTFGIRRGLFGLSFNRPGTEATSPPPTSLGGKVYEAGRQGFQAIVPQVAGAVSTVLTPFANAGSDTAREIQRLTADMHAYASENAALNTAPVDPNAPTTVGSVIEEAVVGAAGALPGLLTQFMAARAFGGMAGFVAGAGVLGAGGQFNESYAEYRKAGFGENSAAANAMANGLIAGTVSAVTNLIPGLAYGYGKDALGKLAQKSGSKLIAKYLGPSGVQAVRVVGVKAVAKAGSVGALKSMVAEGVQETSENIGTDLVVTWRQLNQAEFDQKFKENPEWFKDILVRGWKAGLAGMILGGGPGAMHGVGKHLSRPVGPEVAPHTVVQGEAALRSAAIERAASEGVEPLRGPATSLEMTDEQARNAVENMVAIEPMVKDAAKDDAEHRRKIGEALDLGKFTDAQLGKLWANGNNGETAKFLGGHAPDLDVSVTPEMAADEIARRRDGRASRVATGAMLGVGEDGKVSDEDLADWMAKNPEAVEYARTATSLPRKRLVKWTNRTGPWNTEAFRSELHKRIKAAKPSVDPRAATAAEIAAEITGLPPAQAELVLRGLSPKTAAAVEAVRSGATPMPTDPKPTAAPQAANTRGVDRIADVNKVERGTVREVEPKSPKVKEFAEKRGVRVKFFESDSPIVTSGAVTDGTVFINSALPEGQQMFAVAAHEVLDSLHVSDPQLWGELEAELRRVAPEAMDAIVREYQQRIKDQDGQTLGENDLRREGVSNMAQAMIDAFGLHLAIDGDGNFDKAKMRELVGMNPGAMAKLARLVDRILRSMGFAGGLNRAQSARLEEFAGRDIKELKSPSVRAFIAQSLGTTLNRMVEARGVSHGDALAQSVGAFHGSPHKFDKFSIQKIGTGEGAQAYGWGLYFAGKKEVAEHYKKQLGGRVLFRGEPLTSLKPNQFAEADYFALRLFQRGGDSFERTKQRAVGRLESRIYDWSNGPESRSPNADDTVRQMKDTLAFVVSLKKSDFKKMGGRIYSVELAPEADEYLLWDKPLSEQSEKVRKAIEPIIEEVGRRPAKNGPVDRRNAAIMDGTATGADLYGALSYIRGTPPPDGSLVSRVSPSSTTRNDAAASAELHKFGIRGIKYLDGSSRGKGEGDYNYVIFDDSDVKITDIAQSVGKPTDSVSSWAKEKFGDKVAPNGRKSWRNFVKWFGKSKVVDADGNPLRVYHGTNADFQIFRTTNIGEFGPAIYFTDDASDAGSYAMQRGSKGPPATTPVYLRMLNPFVAPTNNPVSFFEKFPAESDAGSIIAAQKAGYDGVIYKRQTGETHYVVFEPEQIKSATGNDGNFDGAEPSIAQSIDPKKPDKPKKPKPTDEEKVLQRAARAERREQGRMKAALAAKTVAHLAKGIDSIRSRLADRKRSAQARIDLAHRMGRHEGQSVGQTEGQKQARLEAMRAALKTKRETMRAAKKAWLESVRLAKEIGRQERRSGQVVGEIEGQKKVRREAFREAAKAAAAARRAMKNEQTLGQRRIDLSHAIGRHEGQLAGEVEGQKKGRVEGSRVTKKEIKSLLDEAAEAVKQLPTAWQGKYTKRIAAATTKNRMLRVIDSVAKDLAMIPVEQMRGAVARSMKTEAKRIRRRKLTAETAKQVTDLHDAAMAMLSGASGRRLKFTDPADIARRVSIASQLIADARGISSDERAGVRESRAERQERIIEDAGNIVSTLSAKPSIKGGTPEKGAKANLWRRAVNQMGYDAHTLQVDLGRGYASIMAGLRAGKGQAKLLTDTIGDAKLRLLKAAGYDGNEDYAEKAQAGYGDSAATKVKVTLGGKSMHITLDGAMALYAMDGETRPKIIEVGFTFGGNKNAPRIKPTAKELDAIRKAIGEKNAKLVDDYKAAVEAGIQKPLFDKHFELNGVSPKKVEGYFRTRRHGDGVADMAEMLSGKESASSYMARSAPMLEARTGSDSPFVVDGFMATMDRTVADAAKFIKLAGPTRHAMNVLLDEKVRNEIARTMGDKVNDDLRTRVLHGVGAVANADAGWIGTIGHLRAGAKILLSQLTWVRMESGSFGAAAEMPAGSWAAGVARAAKLSPKKHGELLKRIRRENGYFGERGDQSFVGIVAGYSGEPSASDKARVRAAVNGAMASIKNLGIDEDGVRTWDRLKKDASSSAVNAWRLLRSVEFIMHKIDGRIIVRSYLGHLAHIEQNNPGLSPEQQHKLALAAAEHTHRTSQNVSDSLDDTTFTVNQKAKGGIGQLMFPFSSDPLKGYNQAVRAGLVPWAYVPGVPWRKKLRVAAALTGKATFAALVAPAADYAARGLGYLIGADDEDKEIQAVIDQAMYEDAQTRAAWRMGSEIAPNQAAFVGMFIGGLAEQMARTGGRIDVSSNILALDGFNDTANAAARGDVWKTIAGASELVGIPEASAVNTLLSVKNRASQGLDKAHEVLSRKEAAGTTTRKEREVLARIKDRLEAKYEEERKTGKFTTDYGLRKFQAEQRRNKRRANQDAMDAKEKK